MHAPKLPRKANEGTAEDYREIIQDGEFFIFLVTLILGSFALLYGILAITIGDPLWGTGTVYNTAQNIPGAPETWGVIALIDGILIIGGTLTKKLWATLIGTVIQFTWSGFFGVTFIIDCITQHTVYGLTGALVHLVLWALFVARAGFAWKVIRNPANYYGPTGKSET